MRPGLIQGILFDLDNTLIATESLAEELLSNILSEYGACLTADEKRWMVGHRWDDIVAHVLEPKNLAVSSVVIMNRLLDTKDAIITETRPFLPGAVEALTRLAAKYPIGIVSGSFRREIHFVLQLMNTVFDQRSVAIVGSEDVTAGKPNPEPYLTGARKLGITPSRIIVFEDSVAGITSAKAAGCFCIAVKAGAMPHADLSQADLVIDTLENACVACASRT